jgi:hypothetical protein
VKFGKWLIASVASTLFAVVGGYIGDNLIGPTAGFIIGGVAAGFGLWYGARWAKNLLG